ncbi:MAG: hypothetical protein LAT50_17695 [Ectothiorhodospiraceae bacterium]|nr:hypothetical protein [Ectothiorhodospiraceae bacterium]
MGLPFLLLFGISAALALLLPPEYESTATIRIDRHQVPANVIQGTVVTGYINEQLSNLAQPVMSTASLWAIAEEHDLYPELRDENAKGIVASEIRRKTRREILYVDVGEEEQRRNVSVAVAFTVTHASRDPHTAQILANAIAERYIEESDNARAQQAARLTRFLRTQSDELKERIAQHEDALAEFKQANASSLPEFVQFNMNRLENIQDQLDRISENINSLNQLRITLESQLAQLDPRVNVLAGDRRELTPSNQVERLRLEYLSMSGTYAPRHPSFARLRNELQALAGQGQGAEEVLRLIQAAESDRGRLFELRQEGQTSGAEVADLERSVGMHRERIRTFNQGGGGSEPVRADNPAYLAVSSRLQGVESELQTEVARRDALQQRVTEFDSRVVATAGVEREFRVLTRQLEHSLSEYEEVRERLLRAEAAERLESGQIGDRFTLASPGGLPSEPARPMRIGIAMLGFIFAAGTSTGIAAVAEYLDKTLRGVRGVVALWGAPPLATIPVLHTRRERQVRKRRLFIMWSVALVIIAALAWYFLGEEIGVWFGGN